MRCDQFGALHPGPAAHHPLPATPAGHDRAAWITPGEARVAAGGRRAAAGPHPSSSRGGRPTSSPGMAMGAPQARGRPAAAAAIDCLDRFDGVPV